MPSSGQSAHADVGGALKPYAFGRDQEIPYSAMARTTDCELRDCPNPMVITDGTTAAGPGEARIVYSGPAVYIPEPTSNGTPCATMRLRYETLAAVAPLTGFVLLEYQ